jgi:tetratricopeptide (TPR) repeat protein
VKTEKLKRREIRMGKSNDLFGQILSRGPSQSTLFWLLKEMKKEGRSSEVIRECIKALSVYPDDIRLRTLLAESYLEVGFIGQAEAELDRVSSDIAELVSAYKLQAEIYVRQQRAEDAIDALKRYLAHNPSDQETHDLLDSIKKVEGAMNAAVAEEPEHAHRQPLGEIPLPAEGKREEMPDLATPTLAEIHFNQGQIHEAIRTYEKVLSANPDDDVSQERLSELKALIAEETKTEIAGEDTARTRKEIMITVLEGWLERIKGTSHA